MGKANRNQRRRAAVRSAKKTRTNNWWYGLVAVLVIAGVALIVFQSMSAREDNVGPKLNTTGDPKAEDTHWHAALGVYYCDKWLGDTTGDGIWAWPGTGNGKINRVNSTIYAGLHSHEDGLIHMEPQVKEDAGNNATVGRYFRYGGWSVTADSFDFLGTKAKNGDKCGDQPGTLQWGLAKYTGDPNNAPKIDPREGNPAAYKLYDDDIVVIAFLPEGKTLADIGLPPGEKNLENPSENGSAGQMPQPGAQGQGIPQIPASPSGVDPGAGASTP